jgi:hypothetical protein
MAWFRTVMVMIGLLMVIAGCSINEEVSLMIAAAISIPGVVIMFIFGVLYETEKDY